MELSNKMPISVDMIIYINSLSSKSLNAPKVLRMYERAYKGLSSSTSTFLISIDFWVKFICSKNKGHFVDQLLTEVSSKNISLEVQQKTVIESEVHGFFTVSIKIYTENIFLFIEIVGYLLPERLGLFFIGYSHEQHHLNLKNGDPLLFNFNELVIKDVLPYGTILKLNIDNRAAEIIQYLDLSDKDCAELFIIILKLFSLHENFLIQIINRCFTTEKKMRMK